MNPLVIDIHAHFTPQLLLERFAAHAAAFPSVQLTQSGKGVALSFPGDDSPRAVASRLIDLNERRAWMDKNGIDHQLVSGWVESFGYHLPPAEGLAWSRFMNACMRDQLNQEPRFTPLATVPLQDGQLAAQVLAESVEQGFGGVMIGTLPKGEHGNLDDPALDPFWQAAAQTGAAIYVHPMTFCGEPRLDDYGLMNAIGRVEDTSVAVSRLLFSGHLLKFPGMKVILSHGGGSLPYALGRLLRSHHNAQGKVADPAKGFATLYFDSCVFDTAALEFLAIKAGHDRVMLGSDAPFPMSDPQPTAIVEQAKFSASQKADILGATAQKVFRVRGER